MYALVYCVSVCSFDIRSLDDRSAVWLRERLAEETKTKRALGTLVRQHRRLCCSALDMDRQDERSDEGTHAARTLCLPCADTVCDGA